MGVPRRCRSHLQQLWSFRARWTVRTWDRGGVITTLSCQCSRSPMSSRSSPSPPDNGDQSYNEDRVVLVSIEPLQVRVGERSAHTRLCTATLLPRQSPQLHNG